MWPSSRILVGNLCCMIADRGFCGAHLNRAPVKRGGSSRIHRTALRNCFRSRRCGTTRATTMSPKSIPRQPTAPKSPWIATRRKSLGLLIRVTAMSRSWWRSSALIAEDVSCSFLFSSQSSRATSRGTGWNISITLPPFEANSGMVSVGTKNVGHVTVCTSCVKISPCRSIGGKTVVRWLRVWIGFDIPN